MTELQELSPFAASITAVAAGLLSFLSPCVLPLMPAYLSFVTGLSVEELARSSGEESERRDVARRLLGGAGAFVIGFSSVFILIGASAALVGRSLAGLEAELLGLRITPGRIAGLVIVIFGLHLAGVFRIPWLYRERRMNLQTGPGPIGAALLGAAFAFGWTPCIGPVLAGILTLAAAEGTVARGMLLLGLYSLGLAVPFMLMAVSFERALGLFSRVKRHFRAIEIGSGALLVGIGLLVMSGRLTAMNRYMGFFNEWIISMEKWLL
jgi:cytochrome c-type biogenesis protein